MNLDDVIDALEAEDAGMGDNGTSTYGQAALLLRSAAIALQFCGEREHYHEALLPLQDDYGTRARAWLAMAEVQRKPSGPGVVTFGPTPPQS